MTKRMLSLLLILVILCSLLSLPGAAASGDVVTIGDGVNIQTQDRAPYVPYYQYSLTEMIYSADEIGRAGEIQSLAFQVADPRSLATTSLKIYLGHTTKDQFTTISDWIPANDLTLVYEGNPTLGTKAGWETIELTKPYSYNGEGNLVVAVSKTSSVYSNLKYYVDDTPSGIYVLCRSNDNDASAADLDNTANAKPLLKYRPNLRLTFAGDGAGTEQEDVWDGETREPRTENGVYLIGAADELAWFATAVNSGQAGLNARLTADIDLGNTTWWPIGNTEDCFYSGTFDGAGHKITGLKVKGNSTSTDVGLFGYVRGGTIRNLAIYGTVEARATAVNNGGCAGGFVGWSNGLTMENCANYAAVAGKWAGGLVGHYQGSGGTAVTITNCYNAGDVGSSTNTGQAGGLFGQLDNVSAGAGIKNCFTCGTVTIASDSYGRYCGTVAGFMASAVSVENFYYLDTQHYDTRTGNPVRAEDFKTLADSLGGGFVDSAELGHPILRWEAGYPEDVPGEPEKPEEPNVPDEPETVAVEVYGDYVNGYSLIVAYGSSESGYAYNGNAMYRTAHYDKDGKYAYAYLVQGSVTGDAALEKLEETSNVMQAEASGDVNGAGRAQVVDITDARLAYVLYSAQKFSVTDDMLYFLRADVKADYKVDSGDVAAILERLDFMTRRR